jgi:large subunit ribosomal protein L22
VMNMARIDYSQKISGDNIAKAKANELNMSPKHSIEIATFIRHQRVNDAIAYLNDVVGLKKAIPFRRFNRNVAHKRGLPGNWDAGRYPVKASKAYIRVLESVKKNAEYIGLDADNLEIIHVSANRGRAQKSFFPRAMGRATPKVRESVNIEVIVREVV